MGIQSCNPIQDQGSVQEDRYMPELVHHGNSQQMLCEATSMCKGDPYQQL